MNKALFLDRDGVINIDSGYVYKIEDFVFIDGIFQFCKQAIERDYLIVIVTNQGGIARGFYSMDEYIKLTKWMEDEFKKRGITITKTYFSPFHEDGIIPEYTGSSFDRKPNPGMILKAKDEFDIDLSKSILIGDKDTDIEAAKNAGVGKSFLFDHKNQSFEEVKQEMFK